MDAIALHWAAYHNRTACAKLMIEKFSADIYITNEDGIIPLQVAISNNASAIVYLDIINCNQQQISHLTISQSQNQKAHEMIEQYENEHPENVGNSS